MTDKLIIDKCPISEKCKEFENCKIQNILQQFQAKEQECEKAKQVVLQAVEDFNLEYGTPYYDRLLDSAKSLGIEVKDYE